MELSDIFDSLYVILVNNDCKCTMHNIFVVFVQ